MSNDTVVEAICLMAWTGFQRSVTGKNVSPPVRPSVAAGGGGSGNRDPIGLVSIAGAFFRGRTGTSRPAPPKNTRRGDASVIALREREIDVSFAGDPPRIDPVP
jgi:hypothetical protein